MPTQQSGHSATPGSPTPRRRSLADELRSWAPSRLAALLATRPDLAVPTPASLQDVLARLELPATPDPVTAFAAIGALAGDPPRMRAVLDGGPRGVDAVLEKLVWGPPFGKVGAGVLGPAADQDSAEPGA